MELLQAVVMEQLYLPLPSYNTIQTAGFLWLLTFNSLGTHLEMSNCRQIVFECLRSCLPCCPLQSKCMGFRVHNQMAVNELQIWWEHCVAMRAFQLFPTPSSKFVTLLTLIAFNCNFKKCFCWLFHYIYIFFSQPKHVFKSCKPLQEEMPVLHVKYIYIYNSIPPFEKEIHLQQYLFMTGIPGAPPCPWNRCGPVRLSSCRADGVFISFLKREKRTAAKWSKWWQNPPQLSCRYFVASIYRQNLDHTYLTLSLYGTGRSLSVLWACRGWQGSVEQTQH